jgi:hypothetical protein
LLNNGDILSCLLSYSFDGDLLEIDNPYGWIKLYSTLNYTYIDSFLAPTDCTIIYYFLNKGIENFNFLGGFTRLCSEGPGDDDGDFVVTKMIDSNEILWTKTFGSTSEDVIRGLTATPDGGVLLVGNTTGGDFDIPYSYPGFYDDAVVAKLSADGEIEWIDVVGGSLGDDVLASPVMINDTVFQIAFVSTSSDYDLAAVSTGDLVNFLIRNYNLDGTVIEENIISGEDNLTGATSDLLALKNGNTLLAGRGIANSALNPTFPDHDLYEGSIAILNADLELVDLRSFGGSGNESIKRIIYSYDSTCFYTLGFSESTDGDLPGNHGDGDDIWVMKLDTSFNIIWSRNLGSTQSEYVEYGAILEVNDELVIFGRVIVDDVLPSGDLTCGDLGPGKEDAWMVRLDLTTGMVIEEPSTHWRVFPNPSHSLLTIEHELTCTQTEFRVIDTAARLVIQGYLNASMQIDVSSLASGNYSLELNCDNQIFQTQFVVQKP